MPDLADQILEGAVGGPESAVCGYLPREIVVPGGDLGWTTCRGIQVAVSQQGGSVLAHGELQRCRPRLMRSYVDMARSHPRSTASGVSVRFPRAGAGRVPSAGRAVG